MSDFYQTAEERFQDWNYDHPKILHGLIRSLKPAVAVEIGTYRGYAACYMARAIQENNCGHLFCIDNFSLLDHVERYGDPVAHWEENLRQAGVREWATLLKGDVAEVEWPKRVDFAYIDGWHSYQACKSDAERCMALGAECITFDDVLTTVGPRKYFAELSEDPAWQCILIQRDGGLGIAYRKMPMRRVEFIQELPDHPGQTLHAMNDAEVKEQIKAAAKVTGLDYRGVL